MRPAYPAIQVTAHCPAQLTNVPPQVVLRDDSVMTNDYDWRMRERALRASALGEVVLESAYLERLLRCVFTALVGSKYAAVVAGGKDAGWLIDHCKALAKVRRDLGEPDFGQLMDVLSRMGAAFEQRNRVIHDAHAFRPGQLTVTLQSKRSSHDIVVTKRPVGEIEAIADEMGNLADELKTAAAAALGPNCLALENTVRLQLGHDIETDVGEPHLT
jgi:hypothetical protein